MIIKPKISNKELVHVFQKNEFFEDSFSEKFKKIINKIPDKNLTLSEIVDLLGDDGLLLFAALLSVIFLIPVSIPGFSTVFGGVIFFIGVSHLINQRFWLPNRIKNKIISAEKLRTALNDGLKWFHFLEKISKPHRLNILINNKIASKINGLMLLLGSVLLMLPFGLVPFSNTLPALIIFFLSIGTLQKDGIVIIFGYFSVLGTFVYFGFLFSSIILAFKKIVETILL
ncbi:Uncharacterized conserved protein [Algoriphagus alkaliphilus]|uniref:Uncharacterized conserved protein n=1 Tax=Algoriphagus alkaliphilus TaxID=279824 RepID=A0A1G5ZR06_9BACT|nr:exopolysaccharide biosynthesis protein [Algoriphagus alkaliphilus]SDA97268.1 Uncharacterized conserved protein [Algoriphagus alkaliphilus]